MPIPRVEVLQPSCDLAYEAFLRRQNASLLYHSCKYRDFVTGLLGCQPHYLIARDATGVRGALPLMYCDGEDGRVYNSLPFFGSNGGPLCADTAAFGQLIGAYNELAVARQTASSTIVENPLLPLPAERICHNYRDSRAGLLTVLEHQGSPWDDLMRRIHPSARRNVQKAQREDISVGVDHSAMPWLARVHQSNMQAIGGQAKTDAFFEAIPHYFEPSTDFDIFVARKDGLIIAGLLVFYYNRTVEYFTPAIDEAFRSLQPLSLIVITAMVEAASRGFSRWNWGGTWNSQVGVYRFKKKWASLEVRYTYLTQLNRRSILKDKATNLLARYPYFFVVPFSALETST